MGELSYFKMNSHASKIRDMVHEVNSSFSDQDVFDILMEQTCYPFGGPDFYMKQLMSAVRRITRHPGQCCDCCHWLYPYHSSICDKFFDDSKYKKKGR